MVVKLEKFRWWVCSELRAGTASAATGVVVGIWVVRMQSVVWKGIDMQARDDVAGLLRCVDVAVDGWLSHRRSGVSGTRMRSGWLYRRGGSLDRALLRLY